MHRYVFTIKPLKRPCMEHLSNFFVHRASQIWNKLHKSVVSATTFATLKNRLKKFDCFSVSSLTCC